MNRSELAEIFGVSLPTVSAWLSAGMPVLEQGRKGREYSFDTAAVRSWLEERVVAATKGDLSKLSIEEVKKRRETALAALAEIELAKQKGQLVPVDEVARIVGNEAARARSRILSIPAKLRPLADEHTGGDAIATAEIVGAVERLIHEALAEIVSYMLETDGDDEAEG